MAPNAEKRAEKELLRTLAELGGKLFDDDGIVFEGEKIVLPASMNGDYATAIKFLEQKRNEMETGTNFQKTFNYRPWDGAYCMYNAFKKHFGSVGHRGVAGFFGPEPPSMISIPSGVDEQTQVPWGVFNVPVMKNVTFETYEAQHDELGPLFAINAYGPKKFAAHIEGVFNLIERELRDHSMYRGKAFDGQTMPEFIDLSGVDPNNVVYSADVMRQLEAHIWAQLRYTEQFKQAGKPLKRAVLVHGPYGTGKTLAAILTGQEAIRHGWTFIKGRPGRDNLGFVMQTARLYQPSVVFFEDVDQVSDPSSMDDSAISRLLDSFDGIEAKNTEILCVLTTNHPERIHAGMGRPGRLDAQIEIKNLDLAGMEKLVRSVVGNHLADDIDWEQVYEAAEDYMPAFVTEFAHRTWAYSLVRNDGQQGEQLVTEDLVFAAHDLRPQFELMNKASNKPGAPKLDLALQETVVSAVRESVQDRFLAPATNGN